MVMYCAFVSFTRLPEPVFDLRSVCLQIGTWLVQIYLGPGSLLRQRNELRQPWFNLFVTLDFIHAISDTNKECDIHGELGDYTKYCVIHVTNTDTVYAPPRVVVA